VELILGVAIAFGFALFIRLIPDGWLTATAPRAALYAVQVPAGIVFVFVARALAPLLKDSPRQVLLWISPAARIHANAQSSRAATTACARPAWP